MSDNLKGRVNNGDGSPCLHCDKKPTKEGHDACIGTLKNVWNACCGHGETRGAYVQFPPDKLPNYILDDSNSIRGIEAMNYIILNRTINA